MRAFNGSRSPVHSALANGLSWPKSRGRHLAVVAESGANTLAWMKKQVERDAAGTRTDIKNDCHEVCRREVSRGWVDWFILRHSPELTEKKSYILRKKIPVCKFRESSSRKQYNT
jgi:hypothetical protein